MTNPYHDKLTNWLQQRSHQATQPADLSSIIHLSSELIPTFPSATDTLVQQGIDIATELLPTTTDPTLIISCLLHPLLRNLPEADWPEALSTYPDLKNIARGVARMEIQNKIQAQTAEDRLAQSNALRKMLLAMVDDLRVVIVKLCEQTAEVRKLHKNQDTDKRWQAEMGLHVYASLANRLGLGQLKWMLEDLSFRYLEPETYKAISKTLLHKRTEREIYIQSFKERLNGLIIKEVNCHQFEISGRVKHIYSIYRKCKRKNHSYEEINDATALRILLPTTADCYAALSAIHSTWEAVADEFDDYISNPKPNGYRSLHTVIHGPQDVLVEIQLRTFDMHEEAELGVAAHWKYKESRSSNQQNTSAKINWLQSLLSWHEEIDTNQDKSLYREVFQNRIYVFTPNNKVVDLTPQSTPLDFAYYIHTDVGHRCVGAKVNDNIVPLTYQLKTGDQVRILTQKNSTPSRDWLNKKGSYLASRQARAKVRGYFRKLNFDQYVKGGQEIWDKHLGQEKISKQHLKELLAVFNYIKMEDLLCSLGSNEINIRTVINKLRAVTGIGEVATQVKRVNTQPRSNSKKTAIVVEGVSNLMTQLARCCHPVPGDEIKGYITKLSGVSIHRLDCHNIPIGNEEKTQRVVDAQWGLKKPARFTAQLEIISHNDSQTDNKIVGYIVSQDIPVVNHSSNINRAQCSRIYRYQLHVTDKAQLDQLINGLRSIPGVVHVKRA